MTQQVVVDLNQMKNKSVNMELLYNVCSCMFGLDRIFFTLKSMKWVSLSEEETCIQDHYRIHSVLLFYGSLYELCKSTKSILTEEFKKILIKYHNEDLYNKIAGKTDELINDKTLEIVRHRCSSHFDNTSDRFGKKAGFIEFENLLENEKSKEKLECILQKISKNKTTFFPCIGLLFPESFGLHVEEMREAGEDKYAEKFMVIRDLLLEALSYYISDLPPGCVYYASENPDN